MSSTNRTQNRSGSKTPLPHTPSPLVHGSSRTRKNNTSSTSSRSPVVSPTVFKCKSGSGGKHSDVNVDIILDSPSSLCRSLFDLEKCPCNQSNDCWKIDCSKCRQFWHTKCVTLDGLGKTEINKLVNWQCPFCYSAPVSTTEISDSSSCMTCRNTRTLRDANHAFEVSTAAANIKLSADPENTVSSLSMLSSENSIKCIESELKQLHESYQTDIRKLTNEVSELKSELTKSSSAPLETLPPLSSAIQEHDAFLKSVSDRLDMIISASQGTFSEPTFDTEPSVHAAPSSPSPNAPEHGQVPYSEIKPDFIDSTVSSGLLQFLESQSSAFRSESGHAVLSFGAPYSYNGSKSLSKSGGHPPAIPEPLKSLIDDINRIQTSIYHSEHPEQSHSAHVPLINSCLVNRYDGPCSFLPLHSDNEVTIDPDSSIFTLSLGALCKVKFIEQASERVTELDCPSGSLYHMTRKSQDFFRHCIDQGSIAEGTRYSLTFRSVSWTNRNSTCVVGDSNTGLLRFGDNSRSSFGKLMPGRKFWAPRIENIDPQKCAAYNNVVVLCGINDVRQDAASNQQAIRDLCCKEERIEEEDKLAE
ncbi:hypothetical protein ACHWQZ_G016068 [Mnemiopsis leidyi]